MSDVAGFLDRCAAHVEAAEPVLASGRLTRISGLVMEAVGLKLAVGSTCAITQRDLRVEAEVVGFNGERLYLMPTGDPQGLKPGAHVEAVESYVVPRFDADDAPAHAPRVSEPRVRRLPAGTALLGRVLDGSGVPLDGLGALHAQAQVPLHAPPINPILRAPIEQSLSVGVRAIDALLTIGRGQRMGLFAGSGVGKSVLLGMMARYTAADVIVVGLIGERGREVKDFIENILGAEGLRRSVVVAAPADVPPLLRVRGAAYATALAEHFRDRGANVLLIMDSLTRYAMASREIALAIGEPPATKGYPPSVFAKLPALVERAGNGVQGGGSITAFYTVLTEGDDPHDPVADHARAILDGHIVLSRDLAEQGHYPAIDIEASISRVMPAVASRESIARARSFKRYVSRLRRSRDLINVGAYQAGADPVLDRAIVLQPQLDAFVQQDMHEKADPHVSAATLATLIPETGETA